MPTPTEPDAPLIFRTCPVDHFALRDANRGPGPILSAAARAIADGGGA